MAVSAADIRSALNIPETASSLTPQQRKEPPKKSGPKKHDGIPRELYALIGPSAPALSAQLTKPLLKQKPNLGSSDRVKWQWLSFTNPARSDSLKLFHWAKGSDDSNEEYPFAKYNVAPSVYSYTPQEYAALQEDVDWTKDETDYLFETLREFDMRWFVVADRYDYPGGRTRSLEDLKDRYYSVCRKLVRTRPISAEEMTTLQQGLMFDKDREVTRKKYIQSLENRTPDQIAEEEALYIEIKRLEQNERKFRRERDDLLRTLLGIESGLPDVIEDDTAFGLTVEASKRNSKKRSAGTMEAESPVTPISSISATHIRRPPTLQAPPSDDAKHCIVRSEPGATPPTKTAHHPSYMRSYKIPVPKPALAQRVTQIVSEVGINSARLVMPTTSTITLMEGLMDVATALAEVKRSVEKVDYDIRVAKQRLGIPTGDEAEEVEEGDAQGVDDDGRAASVVSTRSGRGRKQSRRSVSVSSVDTTAPSRTKRQRRS
ncbi:hypothetical protein FISHEDRAFT_65378 [Fistulina hepatica ATCC 64428]|nr:hypothetical protein FISHEDRAFT_65378 [Fistulina hepatica ATCC 64428]